MMTFFANTTAPSSLNVERMAALQNYITEMLPEARERLLLHDATGIFTSRPNQKFQYKKILVLWIGIERREKCYYVL